MLANVYKFISAAVPFRACSVGILIGLSAASAPAVASQPLPVEVALHQRTFPPFTATSTTRDGLLTAYTVQLPEKLRTIGNPFTPTGAPTWLQGSEVWVQLSSGEAVAISTGFTSWGPVWSPDGETLAFFSDRDGAVRIWLWSRKSGELRRASAHIARPFVGHQAIRWAADGMSLIVPVAPNVDLSRIEEVADEEESIALKGPDGTSVRLFLSGPAEERRGIRGNPNAQFRHQFGSLYLADLGRIDIDTGRLTRITRDLRPFLYWLSPDSRHVAFITIGPALPRLGSTYNLYIAPVDGSRAPRLIAKDAPIGVDGRALAWSPSSAELAYQIAAGADEGTYLVRPEGGRPRKVAQAGTAVRNYRSSFLWHPSGSSIVQVHDGGVEFISPKDGKIRSFRAPEGTMLGGLVANAISGALPKRQDDTILVSMRNKRNKKQGVARFSLSTGRIDKLWEADQKFYQTGFYAGEGFDVTADGQHIVIAAETAVAPADLWRINPEGTKNRRLTDINPVLRKYRFGASRLIEWTTPSGGKAQGTLLLPSNYKHGAKYPLVVYPYPISKRSQNVNVFGVTGPGVNNMQLLATRGYAVLAPDLEFKKDNQTATIVPSLLAAVDGAVATGVVDPERIGIMGHSWGGWLAITAITHSSRFKAAVARGSYSNQVAFYGYMESSGPARKHSMFEGWYGGTLWEKKEQMLMDSPVLSFDKVNTPLLLIHGEAETNVPVVAANETFINLRRLGKDVEYALYEGEDHGESGWSYRNQVDYANRIISWFDTHLRARMTETAAK